MRFGWNAKDAFNRILLVAYAASILFVGVYVIIYWFEPFSEFWNNFFSNFFLIVASFITAMVATWIWQRYEKADAPRRVWGPFMIGLWLWVAGELAWSYINMTRGEVPIGLPDGFWTVSYLILAVALYHQYQILFAPSLRTLLSRTFISAMFILGFTLLVSSVIRSATGASSRLDALVNSFYPVADLWLAVIALTLARNFAGGAFSRPWLGLIVFSVADLIYAWVEISGLYSWSVTEGNLYSTIADVSYLIAYVAMGLCLLYQWLFLKYGMRAQ